MHDEAMMDELAGARVEIWDRLELELRKAASAAGSPPLPARSCPRSASVS